MTKDEVPFIDQNIQLAQDKGLASRVEARPFVNELSGSVEAYLFSHSLVRLSPKAGLIVTFVGTSRRTEPSP